MEAGHEVRSRQPFSGRRRTCGRCEVRLRGHPVGTAVEASGLSGRGRQPPTHLRVQKCGSGRGPVFDAQAEHSRSLNLLGGGAEKTVSEKIHFAFRRGGVREPEYFGDGKAPLRPVRRTASRKVCVENFSTTSGAVTASSTRRALRDVSGPRRTRTRGGRGRVLLHRLLKGQTAIINGTASRHGLRLLGERGPANVEALSRRRRTGINIGTALGTDVKAVFRKLRDLSGAAGGIRRSRNAGEQRRSVIDNRLAYDELGWYPNMLLDDGLALTLAHFRDKVKSSGR